MKTDMGASRKDCKDVAQRSIGTALLLLVLDGGSILEAQTSPAGEDACVAECPDEVVLDGEQVSDFGVRAEELPSPVQFIVVWKPERGEPTDLAARFGVTIQHKWRNRIVVQAPEAVVPALRADPQIKYVQRVISPHAARAAQAWPPEASASEIPPVRSSAASVITPSSHQTGWYSGEYRYDGAGNIIKIGTSTPFIGLNSDHKQNYYVYDSMGRLVRGSAHTASADNYQTFTYDSFGNLIAKSSNGAAPDLILVDKSTNRLTIGFGAEYDAAGNQTRYGAEQYFYDPFNMMREIWYGAADDDFPIYNADDERIAVKKTAPQSLWVWTIRDLNGKVIREYESEDSPTSPWLWVQDYVYRNGLLVGGEKEQAEGGRRHYHLDHLGTPRLITNQAGQKVSLHTYWPNGVELSSIRQEIVKGYERDDPMKFTSHQRDFLGGTWTENQNYLDYMHARYYNPVMGRFLSVDPKTRLTPLRDPQRWNRYAYAAGNPMRYVDPDGREIIDVTIRHFIPTPTTWSPFGWLQGDNRGFSLSSRAGVRTEVRLKVETDPKKSANPLIGSPQVRTGQTLNRTFGFEGHASGASITPSVSRAPDGSVIIHSTQNEGIPRSATFGIGTVGFGISSTSTLLISPSADQFNLWGSRSGYPAMEVNASIDGGQAFSLYQGQASDSVLGLFETTTFDAQCTQAGTQCTQSETNQGFSLMPR